MMIAQLVCIIVATAIYFPFFKMADNLEYKREQNSLKEQAAKMEAKVVIAE